MADQDKPTDTKDHLKRLLGEIKKLSPDNMTADEILSNQIGRLTENIALLKVPQREWVRSDDIRVLNAIEDIISVVAASSRKECTIKQYIRQYRLMEVAKQRPKEYSGCKGTYSTMRPAFVWGQSVKALRILKYAEGALWKNDDVLWRKALERLEEHEWELTVYAPGSPCLEGQVPRTKDRVSLFEEKEGYKKHHECKRKNARNLQPDWAEQIFDSLPDMTNRKTVPYNNKAAVAVLMILGPRQSESERGVTVMTDGSFLLLGLESSKFEEGIKGQELRGCRISVETPEAEYLANLANKHGGTVLVKASSVSGLSKLLNRAGKRLFGKRICISAYDFRHRVTSQYKSSDLSREDIARLLGHRTTRTQKGYGQAQQARGRRNTIVAVKGSHMVRSFERTHLSIKKQDETRSTPL